MIGQCFHFKPFIISLSNVIGDIITGENGTDTDQNVYVAIYALFLLVYMFLFHFFLDNINRICKCACMHV